MKLHSLTEAVDTEMPTGRLMFNFLGTIAEYFLDCQPGVSPDPLEGPIPAAQNKTTVQPDLAQNTLREPFKDRLRLLVNEFGTALDANAENLNAAIRSGAPARGC